MNTLPVADANDVTAFAWVDGYAEVTLDGTGSSDADGDALEYSWYNDANELIATEAEPNVVLPVGEHTITLIVNDGIEDSKPNSCIVTVIEAIEIPAKMLPQTINIDNNRGQISGRLVFEGQQEPEFVPNQPMLLVIGQSEIEAKSQTLIYSVQDAAWYLTGFFDTADVTGILPVDDKAQITLVSRLNGGRWIYGSDMIKIITRKIKG